MTANDWHKSLSDISEFSLARYPKTVLKKKKKKLWTYSIKRVQVSSLEKLMLKPLRLFIQRKYKFINNQIAKNKNEAGRNQNRLM